MNRVDRQMNTHTHTHTHTHTQGEMCVSRETVTVVVGASHAAPLSHFPH